MERKGEVARRLAMQDHAMIVIRSYPARSAFASRFPRGSIRSIARHIQRHRTRRAFRASQFTRYPGVYAHISAGYPRLSLRRVPARLAALFPGAFIRTRGALNKEPGARRKEGGAGVGSARSLSRRRERQREREMEKCESALHRCIEERDGERRPRRDTARPTSLFATLLRFEAPPAHPLRLNSTCLSVSCSARSPVSISGGLLRTKAKSEQRSAPRHYRVARGYRTSSYTEDFVPVSRGTTASFHGRRDRDREQRKCTGRCRR